MKVYLDNGSTSFPKPKVVADSIYNYLTNVGGNPGRSNHSNALQANYILLVKKSVVYLIMINLKM